MTNGRDDVLALENQVCFALYVANRAVTARYRPLLADLGLTYPQYLVMLVLWQQGGVGEPLAMAALSKRLRLDSGTLTPLLKRLAERGLIAKQRSAMDERTVTISLSEPGLALKDRAKRIPGQLQGDLDLAQDRLVALRGELQSLLRALEAAEPIG